MDPITAACIEYMEHIRRGGEKADLSPFANVQVRDRQRKLHPSGLCLCDRKAVYRIMADQGEIEPDLPDDPVEQLGHHIGYIFQDFVAEALAWKGALENVEIPVENDMWTGRADLLVKPHMLDYSDSGNRFMWDATHDDYDYWLVDVKTVKGYGLYNRYPKEWHIAQVEKYQAMLGLHALPVLYYATRVDFTSALFTWHWEPNCNVYQWEEARPVTNFYDLDERMEWSERAQEHWLKTDELPDRIAGNPTDHDFMCTKYERYGKYKGQHKVTCQFFGQCWGREIPESMHIPKGGAVEDDYPF